MLHRELGVQTLDDLQRASVDGRVRAIKGMGAKKEALILKAIEERKSHAGRHLLSVSHDIAGAIVALLQERFPAATITPVGSLRRGCETCGDIDILAAGADPAIMDAFVEHSLVERVLARGETRSADPFRSDVRWICGSCRRQPWRGVCQSYGLYRTTSRCATARLGSG